MGAGAVLFGLVFLIIVVMIAFAYLSPLLTGIGNASGYYTATQLKPRVGQDETVCDLRIKVKANLETSSILGQELGIDDNSNPFPAKVFVTINKNNPYEKPDWFNCQVASQYNSYDLLGEYNFDFSQYDFFSIGGEKIHGEIVLRDINDHSQKVDAFTQSQLRREILLPAGIVDTPLDISLEYVVNHIPLRQYQLEIYYGREINNMDAGVPIITKICSNGTPSGC